MAMVPVETKHRRARAARLIPAAGIATALAIVAVGLLQNGWPARRFLILYVAPSVAAAALWLYVRISLPETESRRAVVLDGVVFLLALARFGTALLPFSGHMLFFTYSILTTPSRLYRIVAFVILVETTLFKLMIWGDDGSWGLGIWFGVVLALVRFAARNKKIHVSRRIAAQHGFDRWEDG